jgi:PAS domain S-box-containing protein
MTADGVVVDWNDRAVEMFGWSRGEAVGQSMAELIIPMRHRTAHRSGIRRYLETGQARVLGRRVEVSGLRKSGEEFPVELSISPLQDGESVLFVGCVRDITERRALRLARVELARVTQTMAVGEMAAAIAHEIHQPLGAVVVNAKAGLRWLAHEVPNLDEARAALNRIVNDGDRASEVIAGIRSMFKKDDQANALQDVNEIVREVLMLARHEVESHGISVQIALFDQLPQVSANRVQLQLVIANLIRNAIDAMSDVVNRARILSVKTEMDEYSNLLITVEDSGIGIDPKNMDRIFEAFFTTKPHGIGMGLPICRSVVESHGGRMSASIGNPHGTIFKVLLPTGRIGALKSDSGLPVP